VDFAVYVHVPYCRVQCPYCTFYTVARPGEAAAMVRFTAAVRREWELRVVPRLARGDRLSTLYFGGGTPSDLPAPALIQLLESLGADLPAGLCGLDETTVECNPESATPELLDGLCRAGVGRVSLGVQALHADDLARLGRGATLEQNRAALQAVAARFASWNADLIVGIPGSSRERLAAALAELVATGAPHLSFYCLELPPAWARDFGDPQTVESETWKADLYLWSSAWVENHGYVHYEISNAARPGHEAVHNNAYWLGVEYVGLGPGAHSYAAGERRANRADLKGYLEALEAGREPGSSSEFLAEPERRAEELLLGLRLRRGLDLETLRTPARAPLLARLEEAGLLCVEAGRARLTPRGWLVSDSIVLQLLAA
jgi:coproporphyrinogen III oxidase-like Fe-S oxidoreductase